MMGGMGIFEFPAMIEPDGSMGNLIVAVSGVVITMVIGFAATMIFYKEKDLSGAAAEEDADVKAGTEAETKHDKLLRQLVLASPIKGDVKKLETVRDAAFASGVLGKGVAIQPADGNVSAPADGVVSVLFPTLHAIGITTADGVEILIHIGLDTVQLEGKGFTAMVQQGDAVKKGQTLVVFDKEFVEGEGYCLETPVIITNTDQYLDVVETAANAVDRGDDLLNILM